MKKNERAYYEQEVTITLNVLVGGPHETLGQTDAADLRERIEQHVRWALPYSMAPAVTVEARRLPGSSRYWFPGEDRSKGKPAWGIEITSLLPVRK